jgi:hypothetical protein
MTGRYRVLAKTLLSVAMDVHGGGQEGEMTPPLLFGTLNIKTI